MTRDRALLSGPGGVRTFYAENYSTGSKRQLKNAFSEVRVFGSAAIVSVHRYTKPGWTAVTEKSVARSSRRALPARVIEILN